jgi:hypothetical protein
MAIWRFAKSVIIVSATQLQFEAPASSVWLVCAAAAEPCCSRVSSFIQKGLSTALANRYLCSFVAHSAGAIPERAVLRRVDTSSIIEPIGS